MEFYVGKLYTVKHEVKCKERGCTIRILEKHGEDSVFVYWFQIVRDKDGDCVYTDARAFISGSWFSEWLQPITSSIR